MTKQSYIHSSINVVLCFPLHVYNHAKNVIKHIIFYVYNFKVMTKKIGLPIRKLCFSQIWVKSKSWNLCLLDWKPNTISPYSDTTSYNSSPERSPLCSFWTCDPLARTAGGSKKKIFYCCLLVWMSCYFPYNMNMLVFHACSNQKSFCKLENHW